MQEHRATRLHWDFRLEAAGVMPSWAVTKGPTLVPLEKRLAMKTEDHPLDYQTFEGVIPAGNYGAGEVIVWDNGTYELAEGSDPVAQIAAGKLKIVLRGKKLKGLFSLIKIKPRDGEHGEPWLFFKDHDEFDDPAWKVEEHAESVKSGQTLAQLQATRKDAPIWKSNRAASADGTAVKRAARSKAASHQAPLPRDAKPMLATLVDAPFDDDRWLFELKWDGYRAIAVVENEAVTLTSRNGNDLLPQFKELATMATAFRSIPVVVDGELCVLDAEGKPDFQALQARDKPLPGKRRPAAAVVTFVAFDLLYADGRDLRDTPLEERKRLLETLIVPDHGVMFSGHVIGTGKALYAAAEKRGLEGIVGKVRTSPYRSSRSREWVKIKTRRRQEFVIGGWTEPRGSRSGFGALLIGYYDGKELRYAGHVGTGFDGDRIDLITARMKPLARKTSPFAGPAPKTNTRAHWIEPQLVGEVHFTEWTRDGILRHPAFIALRSDKDATTVVRERETAADPDA